MDAQPLDAQQHIQRCEYVIRKQMAKIDELRHPAQTRQRVRDRCVVGAITIADGMKNG